MRESPKEKRYDKLLAAIRVMRENQIGFFKSQPGSSERKTFFQNAKIYEAQVDELIKEEPKQTSLGL